MNSNNISIGVVDESHRHKKARCYGSHHQYRLHNFKGCVAALVSDYNLNRKQAIEVLKGCIKLHADTPDTPNWYLNIIKG